MNYDYIRNTSLILSVTLFLSVSAATVFWMETNAAPASLTVKTNTFRGSVLQREHVEWQFCDPFGKAEVEHAAEPAHSTVNPAIPAEALSRQPEAGKTENPPLPTESVEWVDVAKGGSA